MIEQIKPSVWRRARWNTAFSVSAVRIASGEYQACPPRVVRGAARQAAIASSLNHTVKLPRCRKLASYAAQFVTLRFCFGMWWRRAALALNGMVGSQIKTGVAVLFQPTPPHQPLIRATYNIYSCLSFVRRSCMDFICLGDTELATVNWRP